jgi:hypothetical protein
MAFLILIASTAFGQSPKPAPQANQGTELFRGLLHYHGIKPLTRPVGNMRDCIVVVYGRPARTQEAWDATVAVVRQTLLDGGSVLIATDLGYDVHDFFPNREPIRMIGGPVECDLPSNCLDGRRAYPLIGGSWPFGSLANANDLRIATHQPGAIRLDRRQHYLNGFVKRFPAGSHLNRREFENNEVFAAGGVGDERAPFRCLVVADQDVFTNQMLYASASDFNGITPDNFRFANEVVKWLSADQTRKSCIFIENGSVKERFDEFDFSAIPQSPNLPKDMPMPPIPNPLDRPIQEGLAKTIDNGLAKVEDDNMLNRAFTRDNYVYGWILAAILCFVLSICLSIFIRRVWQSRHRAEFQPLPADPLMLGGDAPLGSFEHRRLELLRGGDFRAPVVAYLRRLFSERGIDAETAGRVPPPLDIRARNHRELKSMIRELWNEAFVFDREPLPYTRWKEIERALAVVRAAADADQWQFRSAQANAEDA